MAELVVVESVPTIPVHVHVPCLNRNPSDWSIIDMGDGTIEASCSSEELFSGTVEDFNIKLRG